MAGDREIGVGWEEVWSLFSIAQESMVNWFVSWVLIWEQIAFRCQLASVSSFTNNECDNVTWRGGPLCCYRDFLPYKDPLIIIALWCFPTVIVGKVRDMEECERAKKECIQRISVQLFFRSYSFSFIHSEKRNTRMTLAYSFFLTVWIRKKPKEIPWQKNLHR